MKLAKHKKRSGSFYLNFLLGLVFASVLLLAGSRLPNSRIRVIDRDNIYGGRTISISYLGDPFHWDKCLYVNDLFDGQRKIKETRFFLTEGYSRKTGCYQIINFYNQPYAGNVVTRIEHLYFQGRRGYSRKVNFFDSAADAMTTDYYDDNGDLIARKASAKKEGSGDK